MCFSRHSWHMRSGFWQMYAVLRARQDAFEKLNLPGEALRGRIRIQYVDHFGEVEAGVDGGGLFKDFMEHLIRQGFDPQARGGPSACQNPDNKAGVEASRLCSYCPLGCCARAACGFC